MFKIKLSDIDRLGSIITELEVISYLQELVFNETDGTSIPADDDKYVYMNAAAYLAEKHHIAISSLRQFFNREDLFKKE